MSRFFDYHDPYENDIEGFDVLINDRGKLFISLNYFWNSRVLPQCFVEKKSGHKHSWNEVTRMANKLFRDSA